MNPSLTLDGYFEVALSLAAETALPILTYYVVKASVVLFPFTIVFELERSFGVGSCWLNPSLTLDGYLDVGASLIAGTEVPILTVDVVKALVVLLPLTTDLEVDKSFGVLGGLA